MEYDYPGNVRELKNIIERLMVMAEGREITLSDAKKYNIFSNTLEKEDYKEAEDRSLKAFRATAEKKYISKILKENDLNMDEAANILQISSRQLYNKIKEYDIKIK